MGPKPLPIAPSSSTLKSSSLKETGSRSSPTPSDMLSKPSTTTSSKPFLKPTAAITHRSAHHATPSSSSSSSSSSNNGTPTPPPPVKDDDDTAAGKPHTIVGVLSADDVIENLLTATDVKTVESYYYDLIDEEMDDMTEMSEFDHTATHHTISSNSNGSNNWNLVMDNFDVQSKIDEKMLMNTLASPNEEERLQGVRDLKLLVRYKREYCLFILPQLFSLYGTMEDEDHFNQNHENNSTLQLLQVITYISEKYTRECQVEYSNHFYNMLHILAKRKIPNQYTNKHLLSYMIKCLHIYCPSLMTETTSREEYLSIGYPNYIRFITCHAILFQSCYDDFFLKSIQCGIVLRDEMKCIVQFYRDQYKTMRKRFALNGLFDYVCSITTRADQWTVLPSDDATTTTSSMIQCLVGALCELEDHVLRYHALNAIHRRHIEYLKPVVAVVDVSGDAVYEQFLVYHCVFGMVLDMVRAVKLDQEVVQSFVSLHVGFYNIYNKYYTTSNYMATKCIKYCKLSLNLEETRQLVFKILRFITMDATSDSIQSILLDYMNLIPDIAWDDVNFVHALLNSCKSSGGGVNVTLRKMVVSLLQNGQRDGDDSMALLKQQLLTLMN